MKWVMAITHAAAAFGFAALGDWWALVWVCIATLYAYSYWNALEVIDMLERDF